MAPVLKLPVDLEKSITIVDLPLPNHKEIVPNDFRDYMSKQSYLELGYSEFEIKLHLPDPSIWKPLVSFGQLYPDTWHEYNEMETKEAMNAIYYMHFPHGGIHGLKIYSS